MLKKTHTQKKKNMNGKYSLMVFSSPVRSTRRAVVVILAVCVCVQLALNFLLDFIDREVILVEIYIEIKRL